MLIIYDRLTGKILETGAIVGDNVTVEEINAIQPTEPLPETVGMFRIYDMEKIQQVLEAREEDENRVELIFNESGEPIDVLIKPSKQPAPPTLEERIEALESALLDLIFQGGGM